MFTKIKNRIRRGYTGFMTDDNPPATDAEMAARNRPILGIRAAQDGDVNATNTPVETVMTDDEIAMKKQQGEDDARILRSMDAIDAAEAEDEASMNLVLHTEKVARVLSEDIPFPQHEHRFVKGLLPGNKYVRICKWRSVILGQDCNHTEESTREEFDRLPISLSN